MPERAVHAPGTDSILRQPGNQHSHDKGFCLFGTDTANVNNHILVKQLLIRQLIFAKQNGIYTVCQGFYPRYQGSDIIALNLLGIL